MLLRLNKTLICSFFLLQNSICFGRHSNKEKIQKALQKMQEAVTLLRSACESLEEGDNRPSQEEKKLSSRDYKEALRLLEGGNFEKAKNLLLPFSKEDGERALNALYWIGICFMEEKKHERAMATLVHFLAKIKNTSNLDSFKGKKREAMKKLVSCFSILKRPADACETLNNIESEFPEEEIFVNEKRKTLLCTLSESNEKADKND